MADAAAVGAIIQVLLGKLLTLAEEQISLVRHFKDDLKKLQGSLAFVQAFLHDAEKKQVTSSAVKVWLRQLEDLVFDADNIIDEIDYELLSKKAKPTENKTVNENIEKVQSCFSCCSIFVQNKTGYENLPISYRREMGSRIKDINKSLDKINQSATDFGLQISLANAQDRLDAYESREENAFAKDPIFLGRENEVSEIVKMLTTASPDGQGSSYVLPIVGMGGQGKTTIAREVFHDERIISHFGDKNRVWVYTSENFDVRNILKNILTSISNTENFHLETQQDILKKLQEHWGTKKYFLVLDDVWKKNLIPGWDDFVYSLSGISSTSNGFCMIVTTRSEEVASIVKTLDVHNLKGLPEDDCWSIIKAKAFRGGEILFDVEEIGKNIAKKCQGLPLAAKVVGGLLSSMKSKDEWSSIEKKWLSNPVDEKHITNVLKLSFDHLPSPSLKKCFAYCSIFPKGYKIQKEQLIELWMAEGFLQTNHLGNNNIDMESTGNNNFNILVRNSLLQYARINDYVNIICCSMHDLVHDLAYSILCGNDDVTKGISKSRYIGYKPGGDGLSSFLNGQEGYVRTLFFDGNVSDIKFSDFESLHTLTLVGDKIDSLPTSIKELKHLRYLDISETDIISSPNSIGELYHLQTLRGTRIMWGDEEKLLPDTFNCLISLRHLHISRGTKLPPEIGKLTSLQTLPYFHVGGEKGYGISELGNLKDLKGKIKIYNLEKVRDKKEAASADLIGKSSIHKIKLLWSNSRVGDEVNDESVLEGLQPVHPNLKKIEIQGYKGTSMALWTSNTAVQLSSLMKIKLEDCSELEEVPSLGQLKNLKSLYLCNLTNVKSIGPLFYGRVDNRGNNIFPALERLELVDMPNLKEWDDMQPSEEVVVVFPCLKYLNIKGCDQLMRAPSHFPCLEKLTIDGMDSGVVLENMCGMKLTTLTNLIILGIQGLECLPDGLFSNNRNLKELYIYKCPNMTHLLPLLFAGGEALSLRELQKNNCSSLRELSGDLHCSLNSLESLFIARCPNLKSIPYPSSRGGGGQQQQGFSSLKRITIIDCAGLTNLPIEMLESCAQSLKTLMLDGLSSNFTNTSEVIGCLHKMTRLTDLNIERVHKFSIFSNSVFQNHDLKTVSSLKNLVFMKLDSSWNNYCVSFNETIDAMLLQFTSLRKFTLAGMEHWECLPEGIQHLNSLQELCLSAFGVEALPEWFGNLSSLKELRLLNFKKLRHFPSEQAMQRLSQLASLHIYECPLLLKHDNNYEGPQIVDSEWPKISHIPNIHPPRNT